MDVGSSLGKIELCHLFGQGRRLGGERFFLLFWGQLPCFDFGQDLNQRFGTNRAYAVKQLAAGHVRVNRNRLHIQNIAGIQPFVQLHNSHAGFGIAVQHGPLDGGGTTVLG